MPPKKRNKRVPNDMSHIISDPSKCGLHYWGMRLDAAFPAQNPGETVLEVGPATGPAHGQELTLCFSLPTDSLPLSQESPHGDVGNVHNHSSTALQLETSSQSSPPLSLAAMTVGNAHGRTGTTPSSSQTQTQPSMNLSQYPPSAAPRHHIGIVPNLPAQFGTGNGFYPPSPLQPSDIPLQIPYTSPATHPNQLSPGAINAMSSLQLPNSSSLEASSGNPFHYFYPSGMGGSLNLSGRTDSNSSSAPYLSPSRTDLSSPEFNSDLISLFPNSPTRYLEASPNVANHIHLSNVGHSLEEAGEESSHNSFSSYPSSMVHTGHLSPLDDGSDRQFPSSRSCLKTSPRNPTQLMRPSHIGYSSMQLGATGESSSLGSRASSLAHGASMQTNQARDVANNLRNYRSDAHEVSHIRVINQRRQRNPDAFSSLSLPLTPESFPSVANSRGAHARRRTHPYRRSSRDERSTADVRSTTGSTAPRPIAGFSEIHDISSFGLQIPDPMIPPDLSASANFRPNYDILGNRVWEGNISRPLGSGPRLNDLPRALTRTSLRSSHPQQLFYNNMTNSSGFYDTNALQLQAGSVQGQAQYDFDLSYPANNDGAGWLS